MNETITSKTKHAQKIYQQLQEIIAIRDVMIWEEGRLWAELRKDNLYKFVFGDYGEEKEERSWEMFLKEVGVPRSTVEMRIRLYDYWVVKKKISLSVLKKIHTRKLDVARKYIENGTVTIVDVLEQSKHLPIDEFKKWVKGNQEPCWHLKRKKTTKQVEVCEECLKEIKEKVKR